MTPYEILGISKDATDEEIKTAYHHLARRYHPDEKPDDPDAQEKMNRINMAYEFLKNPQSRSLADEEEWDFEEINYTKKTAPEEYDRRRQSIFLNPAFRRIVLFIIIISMLLMTIIAAFYQAGGR